MLALRGNLRTQGCVSIWRGVYLGHTFASLCPLNHFFPVEGNVTLLWLVKRRNWAKLGSALLASFSPLPPCSRISFPSRGCALIWSQMAEVQVSLLLMMTCVILGTFVRFGVSHFLCVFLFLFSPSLKIHGRIDCFLGCCMDEPLIS